MRLRLRRAGCRTCPQLGRIPAAQIGAQQVAIFPPAHLAQLFAIETAQSKLMSSSPSSAIALHVTLRARLKPLAPASLPGPCSTNLVAVQMLDVGGPPRRSPLHCNYQSAIRRGGGW